MKPDRPGSAAYATTERGGVFAPVSSGEPCNRETHGCVTRCQAVVICPRMKALVYTRPGKLEFTDVINPVSGAGLSVVRVDSTGICGSDMHGFLGHDERRPPPLILGHEASGTVVAGASQGRRVTVNPLVTCGDCRECRIGRTNICGDRRLLSMPPLEGSFAELVAVPDSNLVEIPPDVPFEHAALTEPMAVCWHAVRLAGDMPYVTLRDSSCLILGGGAIGVGLALCLELAGAEDLCVIETNDRRKSYLEDVTELRVRPARDEDVNRKSWDLVFDAVGSAESRREACRLVRQGGTIVHLGLHSGDGGFDARRATLQEFCFLGTYAYTEVDFRQTAEAIFAGRLGPLDWYETRPLSDGLQAFEEIRDAKVPCPKVILKP